MTEGWILYGMKCAFPAREFMLIVIPVCLGVYRTAQTIGRGQAVEKFLPSRAQGLFPIWASLGVRLELMG